MPRWGKPWSDADLATYLARNSRPQLRPPDDEQPVSDGTPIKVKSKEDHSRYRIEVLSRRRRLTDADAVFSKWAIDGLVLGGLLPDDSPQWLEAVTHTQEKSDRDETVITIWTTK